MPTHKKFSVSMAVCAAAVLMVWAWAPAQDAGSAPGAAPATTTPPPAAAPAATEDDPAKQYNDFVDKIHSQLDRTMATLTKQYTLTNEQQKVARQLVSDSTDAFLKDHGQEVFDIIQRGQELGKAMKANGMTIADLPEDIRRDMAERALPLIGLAEKTLNDFADNFAKNLDETQLATLAAQRQKFTLGLQMAKAQVAVLSSQNDAGAGAAGAGAAAGGPGAFGGPAGGRGMFGGGPGAAAAGAGATIRTDMFERYANDAIKRYHLDEVQKNTVLDVLKQYKDKAQALAAETPASAPTSAPAPTSLPAKATLDQFKTRLAMVKGSGNQKAQTDLFAQFRAEIDKVPSEVQRKMAQEENPAPAPAPAAKDAAAPVTDKPATPATGTPATPQN
jgi:hypothetical protein